MNHYKSSAELKDLAKEKLSGRYGITISAFLLVGCISYFISSLITAYLPSSTIAQYLIYTVVTGIASVLVGVLRTGTSLFYLNIACGQPYRLEDIFYGVSNQPFRSLTVSLANSFVNILCLTPAQIFTMLFLSSKSNTYLMLMFVSAGIGLLIYVPVSLGISQSFYILLDFPEYTGRQALTASLKLMKGHKGRLFYLQASFLPLMLLCTLSFGLGFLWLSPYMNMTYTQFFLDIMNPKKAEAI